MKTNEADLARLAGRLAIPERAPDEAFVARVAMEVRARSLLQDAKRDRREQLIVEIVAAAALIIGIHQWSNLSDLTLILPMGAETGSLVLLSLFVTLLLTSLAATDILGGSGRFHQS